MAALHPQAQGLVDAMAGQPGRRETHQLSPAEARLGYRLLGQLMGPGPDVFEVREATAPGPAGAIPLRIYRPCGEPAAGVLVYYHGGGWTIGDLETHDKECRILCRDAGRVVVAVDYRLAPENPFPAALEDAWAALQFVAAQAAAFGGDLSRLAVGGDSAGGNLAAVVAQMARDLGGPALDLQLLIYPSVDARPDAFERWPSRQENAAGPILLADTMRYFFGHYLGDQAVDLADARLSPLLASSLAGLPPALILTAECDPLRDEGEAYAAALRQAGGKARCVRYDGMPHAFFQLSTVLDAGREALAECVRALRLPASVS